MASTKVKYFRTPKSGAYRKSDSALALRSLGSLENEEEHKAEVEDEKPHISLTDPKTLTPGNLLHLQSTHGNQAVQRLLAKSRQANGTGMPVQRLTSATTFQKIPSCPPARVKVTPSSTGLPRLCGAMKARPAPNLPPN